MIRLSFRPPRTTLALTLTDRASTARPSMKGTDSGGILETRDAVAGFPTASVDFWPETIDPPDRLQGGTHMLPNDPRRVGTHRGQKARGLNHGWRRLWNEWKGGGRDQGNPPSVPRRSVRSTSKDPGGTRGQHRFGQSHGETMTESRPSTSRHTTRLPKSTPERAGTSGHAKHGTSSPTPPPYICPDTLYVRIRRLPPFCQNVEKFAG